MTSLHLIPSFVGRVILLLALLFSPVFATPAAAQSVEPTYSATDDLVGCFDYYDFNSISTELSNSVGATAAGVPITYEGTIQNDNPYPVFDAGVYVKVYHLQESERFATANGFELVDQFFALEDLTLPANDSLPIEVTWDTPANAVSGDYRLVTYVVSDRKYNFSGLTFTDDVYGETYDFSVSGGVTETVRFDRNTTTIDGEPHYFASGIAEYEGEGPITMTATVDNETDASAEAVVWWEVYAWDGLQFDKRLSAEREFVTVGANSSQDISYELTDTDYPVYFVVATLEHEGTKSILHYRFVRDGNSLPRINYPALTDFPVAAGESTTLFSCLHAIGDGTPMSDATLTLKLETPEGESVHEHQFTGQVPGNMVAVADTFTPAQAYPKLNLVATLEQDGVLVEESVTEYDCAELGPDQCPEPVGAQTGTETTSSDQDNEGIVLFLIGITIVALIAALLVLVVGWGRRNGGQKPMDRVDDDLTGDDQNDDHANTKFTATIIAAFMIGGATLAFPVDTLQAQETLTWNYFTSDTAHAYTCKRGDPAEELNWWEVLDDIDVEVTYRYEVTDGSGNTLQDTDSVPVGTTVYVNETPHQDTDVVWSARGRNLDTPFGHWETDAAAPQPEAPDPQDRIYNFILPIPVYTPLSVNPPVVSHVASGTAGYTCNGDNTECTVTSPGSLSILTIYNPTYAKMYFYSDIGCVGEHNQLAHDERGDPFDPNNIDEFIIDIPTQTNTVNLTVSGSATPPSVPTVTGPSGGMVNTSYQFDFVSTDPAYNIAYEVDWNSDGVVDQRVPGTGHVGSGVNQQANRSYASDGLKTVNVRAVNELGLRSGWGNTTIEICPAGTTWDGSSCVTSPPDILSVCQAGTLVVSGTGSSVTRTLADGATERLTVHYGPGGDCGDTAVSSAAFVTDTDAPTDAVSPAYNVSGNGWDLTASNPDTTTRTEAVEISYDSKTVTVDYDVPASSMPTADLTINGSDGPITVTAGDPLNLSWTSSNVATCESTGDGWNNASQSLTGSEVVSATVTGTYELTCHDSSAVTDSVDVTVNPAPNAPPATPTITGPTTREENESGSYDTTATDPDGDQIQYEYDWDNDGVVDQTTTLMPSGSTDTQTRSWATAGTYTFNARAVDSNGADSGWANLTVNVSAVPPPNLTVGTIDVTTSAGYDETTNAYDSVGVNSEVLNGGASDAGNSTVRIELDYNNDGTIDQTDTVSVPALTVGDTVPVSTTFSDVPIGSDHRVIVTADADDDVVESPPAANENDNVRSSLIDVIPPDPGLVLTADDEFVRWNQDTVVRWQFTNAVFPMNCAVSGPQISLPDFDPSLAGAPTSAPTQPLTATALYEIVCTEPITGASWRDTVKVENFGTTEEL